MPLGRSELWGLGLLAPFPSSYHDSSYTAGPSAPPTATEPIITEQQKVGRAECEVGEGGRERRAVRRYGGLGRDRRTRFGSVTTSAPTTSTTTTTPSTSHPTSSFPPLSSPTTQAPLNRPHRPNATATPKALEASKPATHRLPPQACSVLEAAWVEEGGGGKEVWEGEVVERLVGETGLTKKQINNWLYRRRLKNSLPLLPTPTPGPTASTPTVAGSTIHTPIHISSSPVPTSARPPSPSDARPSSPIGRPATSPVKSRKSLVAPSSPRKKKVVARVKPVLDPEALLEPRKKKAKRTHRAAVDDPSAAPHPSSSIANPRLGPRTRYSARPPPLPTITFASSYPSPSAISQRTSSSASKSRYEGEVVGPLGGIVPSDGVVGDGNRFFDVDHDNDVRMGAAVQLEVPDEMPSSLLESDASSAAVDQPCTSIPEYPVYDSLSSDDHGTGGGSFRDWLVSSPSSPTSSPPSSAPPAHFSPQSQTEQWADSALHFDRHSFNTDGSASTTLATSVVPTPQPDQFTATTQTGTAWDIRAFSQGFGGIYVPSTDVTSPVVGFVPPLGRVASREAWMDGVDFGEEAGDVGAFFTTFE